MTVTITATNPETRVNTTTANQQQKPAVAAMSDGGHIVVWQTIGPGIDFNIYAQRFGANGAPVGGEFLVNTYTNSDQRLPSVTGLVGGGYAISWQSYGQDGDQEGVYTQLYDANGLAVGAEARVNTTTTQQQSDVAIAGLNGGGYVMAWASYLQDGAGGAGVYQQRFDASGAKVGGEALVNTATNNDQSNPSVARLSDGGYVIVWQSLGQDWIGYGAYGQRYDANGVKVGAEFHVNANPSNPSFDAKNVVVAGLAGGGFVVSWAETDSLNGDIYAQRFDASGSKVGSEAVVNTHTSSDQAQPTISALADGGYVIGWASNHGVNAYDTYTQRFDASGVRVGGETLVNTYNDNYQDFPGVAGLIGGGYAVVWESNFQDGDGFGVYEQLLGGGSTGGATLSSAIELAQGDGADDTFLAPSGSLNSGDVINGGAGFDTIQFTGPGTFNFTGVNIASIERIQGSAGDDLVILDGGRISGGVPVLDGAGGTNTLQAIGNVDLDALGLAGVWHATAAVGAAATFTTTSQALLGIVDGSGGAVAINAPTLNLTAEDRAGLFDSGVDLIVESGGRSFLLSGSAFSSTPASAANSTSLGQQGQASVGHLSDGGYVVTWFSGQAGANLLGQRYDASGAKVGGEMVLQTPAGGNHSEPRVAGLGGGGFVVVWTSDNQDIGAQAYTAAGIKVGAELLVNTTTTGSQINPSVIGLTGGGFAVAWSSDDSSGSGVFVQAFDSNGAKVGSQALANTTEQGFQGASTISALTNGGFVVAWSGDSAFMDQDIYAQRFDSAGGRSGGELLVNTKVTPTSNGNQTQPTVTGLADGGFIVGWTDEIGGQTDIQAQRYNNLGQAQGGNFLVNTTASGNQTAANVTSLSDGGYVVGWSQLDPNGVNGVFTQRYDSAGQVVGGETPIATTGTFWPAAPHLASIADGGYAIAWNGTDPLNDEEVLQRAIYALDYHVLSNGADTVVGKVQDTLVVGTAANLGAADSLDGGGGVDTLELSGSGSVDLTALAAFNNFEVIQGASGADTIGLNAAILAGLTSVDLRGGVDTVTFASSGSGVTAMLSGGVFQNVENLIGSGFDDTLGGSSGANTLVGGAGHDTVTYAQAASGVTVSLAVATAQATGGGGVDTVSGFENLTGSSFADTLTGDGGVNVIIGNAGADTIDGGGGADLLYGGAGNDTYYADTQSDLVFENAGEGTDTVIATAGYYLWPNIENLTLAAGSGSIFGVGNELANTLTGNEGDNLLIGWDGNDTLNGGAGNDALFGVNGDDVINGQAGIDYLVGGSGNDILDGGADPDSLYGEDGNDTLIGGADFVTDIMVGGNGDDILHGDSGLGDYDLMDGGAGNDTYYVDTPADLTFEAVGGGTDTVIANIVGAGYYLYANVENLILQGATPYGVGNELDNVLTGSALSNWLLGGAGNDTLNGKAGNDVLFGEAGADTFVFERGTGGDVIGDFQVGVDKIEIDGIYSSFAELQAHMVDNGGTTAIDLGLGDFVVVNGVAMASLTAGDFVFKAGIGGQARIDQALAEDAHLGGAHGAITEVPEIGPAIHEQAFDIAPAEPDRPGSDWREAFSPTATGEHLIELLGQDVAHELVHAF